MAISFLRKTRIICVFVGKEADNNRNESFPSGAPTIRFYIGVAVPSEEKGADCASPPFRLCGKINPELYPENTAFGLATNPNRG